jgi:multiple sugar transport system substrate-binding protein
MKLKKALAVALTATMAFGTLTGCNKSGNDTTTTTDASQNETTTTEAASNGETPANTGIEACTIEFWHAMNNKQEEELTALTNKFNETNEYGITVNLTNQGKYSDLSSKLTANAAADTLPDLAQAYNNWLSAYSDKLVHLDDFVANDFDNWDDIVAGYRDENSQFGFISGVPFNKSTYVLFYNKTMFDELDLTAPLTWNELLEQAKIIKEEKGIETIGWDDLAGMFQAMLAQNGCGYIDENGALFDNEKGLETVEFIMNLYNNGYARLVGEDKYFSNVISNQLIASYVGSSTGASYITADGWELGVAPLASNTEMAANAAGTNIVMFSKDTNKQKAAWEYLKFLTSSDATTEWAMATGYLPVRTSAYESETYQQFMATDPTSVAAYSQAAYFISQPAFEGSYDVMTAVNNTLEEQILNEADAQTTLDALVKAVNDILQK